MPDISNFEAFYAGLFAAFGTGYFYIFILVLAILGGVVIEIQRDKTPSIPNWFRFPILVISFQAGFMFVFVWLGSSGAAGPAIFEILDGIYFVTNVTVAGFAVCLLFWPWICGRIGLKNGRFVQAALVCVAFCAWGVHGALGYTPSVGPVLGAILVTASNAATSVAGILLLTTYSLALGLPLFLSSVVLGLALQSIEAPEKLLRFYRTASIGFLALGSVVSLWVGLN